MSNRIVLTLLLAVGWASLMAQPYNPNPDWRSTDRHYATGGQFVDLNLDGWLDFVVSNGNDMRRERVGVYYNRNGVLETYPSWESSDLGYHGHLAVGDVNQDGLPDVAVGVLLPEGGPGVKLYLNRNGRLSTTPDWTSTHSFNGWHCAFGDPDGDGDLDLAIGSFWPYGSGATRHFIFFNRGGTLERTASWQITNITDVAQMEFCDVDNDGDLDLVLIAEQGNMIYRNHNGVLSTVPDWTSTDSACQFANTLAIGDVSGDGRPDLVMSDNNQVSCGSGRFKLYRGLSNGVFENTYSWSYFDGYVAPVALADVNNDGKLDLATGKWWGVLRLFLNTGSGFPNTPSWNSAVSLVAEAICFGDINRDGVSFRREFKDIYTGETRHLQDTDALFTDTQIAQLPRKLFYLDNQPIDRILRVVVDGRVLSPTEYCFNLTNAWVSLKNPPQRSFYVEYEYSQRLDMGVTDWQNGGNIVFLHR